MPPRLACRRRSSPASVAAAPPPARSSTTPSSSPLSTSPPLHPRPRVRSLSHRARPRGHILHAPLVGARRPEHVTLEQPHPRSCLWDPAQGAPLLRSHALVEHYGALFVDLLGRAGRLDQARHAIEIMPMEATLELWGAA
jgi:hypothetical protein